MWFDINGIESGEQFVTKIISAIEKSDTVLFCLSDNSINSDYAQKEVMYAYNTHKNVIPALLKNGTLKGWFLFTFGNIDCIDITNEIHVDKLLNNLSVKSGKTIVNSKITKQVNEQLTEIHESEVGAIYHISTDCDCSIEKFGKKIGDAYAGVDNYISLKRGRHKLKFISLHNPTDFVEMVIVVESNDLEDFIEIELTPIINHREESERRVREVAERKEAERKAREAAECKEIERKESERKAREESERKTRDEEATRKIEAHKARTEWLLGQDDSCFIVTSRNNKYGVVDKIGAVVTQFKYDWAKPFSDGRALVLLDGKYGFIDKTGKLVIPLKYDHASPFSEGLARVTLNGKSGFIDTAGVEIISMKYDYTEESFKAGLARVQLNGKYGYIDKNGKELVSIKYDEVDTFSEGLAQVKLDGKYGFVDMTGYIVIPIKYDYADSFSEGLAKVRLNGKYGCIDKLGMKVVPIKYDDIDKCSDGLVVVKSNGKYGYINKSGREVTPLKYEAAGNLIGGRGKVKMKGKYGFIDKAGKEVIPLKYDFAYNFNNGVAKVTLTSMFGHKTETFCIDKQGKRIK